MSLTVRHNDLDFLRSVLLSLPDGVAVTDTEGGPIFLNPSGKKMLGVTAEEISPAAFTTACGFYLRDKVTPCPPERSPVLRAAAGEELADELMFVKNSRRPSGAWISVSGKPLVDDGGAIRGGLVTFRDITDCERTNHEREFIERLSRALEQTADTVIITDTHGKIEYVNHAFEATTGFSKAEALGNTPRLLKSGEHDSEFYHTLWGEILAGNPYRCTIVNRKKSGELYWSEQTITPMKDGQGNITHFVTVLKDITDLLERKEREIEMRLAREVQQPFYKAKVSIPGFDISGTASPAEETGGDYFDFVDMPNGCLGVVIGDVCGHGISSALIMAEMRAYLRSFAATASDVGEVLTQVNQALELDLDKGRFVTLLMICLDPRKRSVTYASAGHEPGYLLGGNGDIDFVFESTGPPLGLFPDTIYSSSKTVPLEKDQIALLLTDGVFDSLAADRVEFLALEAVEYVNAHRDQPAGRIAEGLCESCRLHCAEDIPEDDVTSVILKVI
jgi:PAS domain S-box-containing protein